MKTDKSSILLEDATKYMNDGKFSRAFSLLKELLAEDPGHHEARRLYATLLLRFGNLATAQHAYETLLQEAFQRDDESAESLLKEYLAVGSRYVPFIEMLGQVYERKGDAIAAAIEYEKAIKIMMDDGDSSPRVRELYEKIIRLAPNSFVAERLTSKFELLPSGAAQSKPAVPVESPLTIDAEPLLVEGEAAPPHFQTETEAVPEAPPAPTESVSVQDESASPFRLMDSTESVEPERPFISEQSYDERVPFPPVNRLPIAPVEEPVPPESTDTEPPFWQRAEEPDAIVAISQREEPQPDKSTLKEIFTETFVQENQAEANVLSPPEDSSDPLPYEPAAFEHAGLVSSHERSMEPPHTASELLLSPGSGPGRQDDLPGESVPCRQVRRSRSPLRPKRSFRTWARVRLAILAGRCVSAVGSVTRLVIFLLSGFVGLTVLGILGTIFLWVGLEQKPSDLFRDLAKVSAPRKMEDPLRNGYFLLYGLDAESLNPVQAGYERWLNGPSDPHLGCRHERETVAETNEPVARFETPDPATQFEAGFPQIKNLIAAETVSLNRYRQWLAMPFEDWGLGSLKRPDCRRIIDLHRLYVAEGLSQDFVKGLERLESDLAGWRTVLGQAKTLTMKDMAIEAIHDDLVVLSGLLNRPALDGKFVQRLMRLARPLDHDERSLRWPMQNEFLLKVRRMEALRSDADADLTIAQVLLKLPLPKQRTLNAYAAYYEALIKTPQTKDAILPKGYEFTRSPARTWLDYLTNPIDNLVRESPGVDWMNYAGMILKTDARFRLAGLQARLRGAPSESHMLSRLAQAGPRFFDPFTELPMLINAAQGRLYSVGMDGKDDGGDPTFDISVPLSAGS